MACLLTLTLIMRSNGMDCGDKSNSAKRLIQARLPFKRLNPELKGNVGTKRARGPPTSSYLGSGVSDGENDTNDTSPPQCQRPPIVNGRGPLDGFVIKKRQPLFPPCAPVAVVDLTEDSNSSDTVQQQSVAVPAPSSAPTDDSIFLSDLDSSHTINSNTSVPVTKEQSDDQVEEDDHVKNAEMEENMEGDFENECIHENGLRLSTASSSSLSTVESSPDSHKTGQCPPSSSITEPDGDSEMKDVKRISPKNLKQKEERQQQRAERERQRMEAKAANEKKKLEARKLKEEKEKERKEKKEKEEREKREKKEKDEKEKAEKLRAKEEQRKSKQEAKEEEKRKKVEEKRMKEEKDRIKAEKAEITRFLQKPKTQLAPKTLASACGKFAPFEIKENMCLAPVCRVQCENAVFEQLDQYLVKPDRSITWLKELTRRKPRYCGPTLPKHQDPGSLVVMEGPQTDGMPDQQHRGRMKLLQFHENYRPAYWGTWRKKSKCISARCPIQQDKELFDYEVDSDEEWEEEEPGESLSHSEGDDDEEGDDDDDDDGFFVPHGYLSDGEGAREEEEGAGDPEKQKLHQKLKAREWDELLSKKRVKVLEAVINGCLWEGEIEFSHAQLVVLQAHAISVLEPLPKDEPSSPENSTGEQRSVLLPQLLPLLHGNVNSSKVIISEFQEFCRQQAVSLVSSPQGCADSIPTRVGLKRLIKESAVYEKRSCFRRLCWYVHADILARHSFESLPVPCQWNYLTPGVQQCREDSLLPVNSQGNSPNTPQPTTTLSSKRKSAGSMSIKKFMKKCVDQEQTEVMETDGFQADTEDEEEDCVYIGTGSGFLTQNASSSSPQPDKLEQVEVNSSTAVLLPCP
ncbi:chromatin assembly factor 1 subunit A isoform X2 [Sardina pilchardus]|uniref:chromatin assembly factor 1 subunit A isoform X2 n=1 Tax=Sardina pilchardus TaxID=27697 RepID=UPI002E121D73